MSRTVTTMRSGDLGRGPSMDGRMRANVGDTLIMAGDGDATFSRLGTITAVLGPDGSPPYRVLWLVGEYESLVVPGPGAHVKHGH